MPNIKKIEELTSSQVPTIIGMDESGALVFGRDAKKLREKGLTNVCNFKLDLAEGGKVPDAKKYYAAKNATNFSGGDYQRFSPIEAAQTFLSAMLESQSSQNHRTYIVGEPAKEGTWRENYRRSMKAVFNGMDLDDPVFFPEPFAVFQYYRHMKGAIPTVEREQNVLIIDVGAGTFDVCIIQTTKKGALARAGRSSLPLAVESSDYAGNKFDQMLLECILARFREQKLRFKDSPEERALQFPEVLAALESAKITLSHKLEGVTFSDYEKHPGSVSMHFPEKMLHSSKALDEFLYTEDLATVAKKAWDKELHKVVRRAHNAASKKIGKEIERYDKVLIAGGSGQFPFMRDFVVKTLATKVEPHNIIVTADSGSAVAHGMAIEASQQIDRIPSLTSASLKTSLLSSLYLFVSKTKDPSSFVPVEVLSSDFSSHNHEGLVYNNPNVFQEDSSFEVKCRLPFQPAERTYYAFSTTTQSPFEHRENTLTSEIRLDITDKINQKFDLELHINSDGAFSPELVFHTKSRSGRDQRKKVEEIFTNDKFRLTGNVFVGVDFGTSNSYLTELIVEKQKSSNQSMKYPEFHVSDKTMSRLREVERQLALLGEDGLLTPDSCIARSKKLSLDFVYNSNKLEGNTLSKGETRRVIEEFSEHPLSVQQKEALNLSQTFEFLLENYDVVLEQFQMLAREMNKNLLDGIRNDCGEYRSEQVELNGMDFVPADPGSVQDFMRQLAEEINDIDENTPKLELAVRLHTKFVAIHPFMDGNGRTARLLLNAVLMLFDYPILIVNGDDKERYLDALQASNNGSLDTLMDFFIELANDAILEIKEEAESSIAPQALPVDESTKISTEASNKRETETTSTPKIQQTDSRRPNLEKLKEKIASKKTKVYQNASARYKPFITGMALVREEFGSIIESIEDEAPEMDFGIRDFSSLSEEQFLSCWNKELDNKTFYFSLSLECYPEFVEILFRFSRITREFRDKYDDIVPVGLELAIRKKKHGVFEDINSIPMSVSEVGYADGSVVFCGPETENVSVQDVCALILGDMVDLVDF